MLDKLYYLYPPVQTIKLPICPQYLYPTSKIIYTEIVVPYRVMRKVKKTNNKTFQCVLCVLCGKMVRYSLSIATERLTMIFFLKLLDNNNNRLYIYV